MWFRTDTDFPFGNDIFKSISAVKKLTQLKSYILRNKTYQKPSTYAKGENDNKNPRFFVQGPQQSIWTSQQEKSGNWTKLDQESNVW